MASPRPVPPYLRVVDVGRLESLEQSLACTSLLDADAGILDFEAQQTLRCRPLRAAGGRGGDRPRCGELDGVARQMSSAWVKRESPSPSRWLPTRAGVRPPPRAALILCLVEIMQPTWAKRLART